MITTHGDEPNQRDNSLNPLTFIKSVLARRRESSQFPEICEALKQAHKIGENGISIYDALRRFDNVLEHPNKRHIFLTLQGPVATASDEAVDFMLSRTAEQARGGKEVSRFVAGAVRTLLAKQAKDPSNKAELLIRATDYFELAETYTEALGACLLASTLVAEPTSSVLRERSQRILLNSILQLEDLGLGINAMLKVSSMLGTLEEYGVLSQQEIAGLNLYMQRFFANLG